MLSRIDLEKAFLDRWKMLLFLMQEIFDIANKKFNKLKKDSFRQNVLGLSALSFNVSSA